MLEVTWHRTKIFRRQSYHCCESTVQAVEFEFPRAPASVEAESRNTLGSLGLELAFGTTTLLLANLLQGFTQHNYRVFIKPARLDTALHSGLHIFRGFRRHHRSAMSTSADTAFS